MYNTAPRPPITLRAAWLLASVMLACACFYFASRQIQASGSQITITTLHAAATANSSASSSSNGAGISHLPAVAAPKATAIPNCTALAFGVPSQLNLADASDSLSVQADQPTTYRIYGNTVDDLRAQIQRCAPAATGSADAEFTAQTDYSLSWQYDVAVTDAGCTLADVKVGLHTAMALPYWQPTGSAAAGLAGRWQSFASGLAAHEQGHADIDKTYAGKLLSDLNGLVSVPCNAITSNANGIISADVAALNQANDAYDASTDHGATQGAVLPAY